jgi:hypothetical protein
MRATYTLSIQQTPQNFTDSVPVCFNVDYS